VTHSRAKLVPYAIAAGVILVVGFLQSLRHWSERGRVLEELEWKTYDWRARSALRHQPPCATNLGFVRIDDRDISNIAEGLGGELDYQYGLYWPRAVYGRLVNELKAQGAKLIAFDVLFAEPRVDHPMIQRTTNEPPVSSDEFFADAVRAAGNVALATSEDLAPHPDFRDATTLLGDISTLKDSDGVLRRASAFHELRFWNRNLERYARLYEFDPAKAITEGVELPIEGTTNKARVKIELDTDGKFDVTALRELFEGVKSPGGIQMRSKAFHDRRIWHMGIVMAAAELGLDLAKAEVDLAAGRIVLPGTNGVSRTLPVDGKGRFYVDWSITDTNVHLTTDNISLQLMSDKRRRDGRTNKVSTLFKDKVLIVGSTATGNDLTDRGGTPIQNDTVLVGKHWNVANSVIMGRFITRSPLWLELLIVAGLGLAAAGLTIRLEAPRPTPAVLLLAAAYIWLAHHLYVGHRQWLPIFLPVVGALLLTHVALVTYQSIFEQREKRRVKGVFAKLVSPNVVNQLLQREEIHLGGKRERITVFFSDVRGFTTLTDTNQASADKYVRDHGLTGAAAEAHYDQVAAETLQTVNLYLAAIADQIKKHDGTLDKYIGDCVMAFWGAPTPDERHAVNCVRAAIDAQIAMHQINLRRKVENDRLEAENARRATTGEEPLPLLPLLALGTGINTGTAIVGMMGSEAHIINYTIFGRDVNLASRLEGVSGHSRIIIGEATLRDLERLEPELARVCVELDPVKVKGIASEVRIWEVPWKHFLPPEPAEPAIPPAAPPAAH
jgi:class 3 adenylate cyclase/CHASE2 domain-containing sensor protein